MKRNNYSAMVAALAIAASISGEASAEQVCVEMVAGVCLKYREAPSASPKPQPAPAVTEISPAQREERALQLDRSELREVQAGLRAGGYYGGPLDGAIGAGSRRAISRWQSANEEAVTGYLTFDQVKRIVSLAAPAPSAETAPAAPVREAVAPEPTAPQLPAAGEVYRATSDAPPPEAWRSLMRMRISVSRRDETTATINMKMSGESKFAFDKDCVVTLNEDATCEFAGPFRSGNTWILRGQLPNVTVTNGQVAFSKSFTFW